MRIAALCLALFCCGTGHTHPGDKAVECEEIKQEIRYIRSKMRAGYTRAEGEKLEAKLRKLRALRAKACR